MFQWGLLGDARLLRAIPHLAARNIEILRARIVFTFFRWNLARVASVVCPEGSGHPKLDDATRLFYEVSRRRSMRVLWTLLKVIIGLAITIPIALLALALTAGLVGTFVALVVIALKLAIVGAIGYGVFRLARALLAPSHSVPPAPTRDLSAPAPDRYYEAAMRELDAELGVRPRS